MRLKPLRGHRGICVPLVARNGYCDAGSLLAQGVVWQGHHLAGPLSLAAVETALAQLGYALDAHTVRVSRGGPHYRVGHYYEFDAAFHYLTRVNAGWLPPNGATNEVPSYRPVASFEAGYVVRIAPAY